MFKIGEFSKFNQITIKTLRHYDRIGLFKPQSIDDFTGYRLYTSSQLPIIQKIIALKNLGLSLDEIKELIADPNSLEITILKLEKRAEQTGQEIELKQNQLHQLSQYISFIKEEKNMPTTHVTIKELPEVLVASKRVVIKNHDQLNSEMPQFGQQMSKHGVKCAKPDYCFNIYHDGEYKPTDIDVEMCQAITELKTNADGIVYKKLTKVPQAACIYHHGPYQTLGQTYAKLMQWLEENNYQLTNHPRESYIDGIWNKENVDEWLTEIQAPIAPTSR